MPSPRPALSPNMQGALWMLGSVAGATFMTVAIRVLAPELHTTMLAFLRSALGVVLVAPMMMRARQSGRPMRFIAWKLHLGRGVLISLALNGGFYAIWKLPMATATILFFMAPVFATVLAGPILGERVGPRRWSAICISFLGAVIILRPWTAALEPGMIWALASSTAFALALLLGKIIARIDGTDAVFVSSSLIVVVATLPPALLFWSLPGTGWQWLVVGVLAGGSALRTYSDIRAYAVGEAGFIAPFAYLRLLSVGVIGYFFFAEIIDAQTISGGAVIIFATLYIALREGRLRPATAEVKTP